MKDGPVTKHQQLAQTGHVEGYKHGGHTSMHKHHPSSHHGGHTSMKHGGHVGHGSHGHKGPHEHHTNPGHHSHHSGHKGHSIHSFVHGGKNPPEHVEMTHTHEIETDGGGGSHHRHDMAQHGTTGGTRNPV